MIKRHYSANSREALNVIWNAAGRYGFDPPFLAFYPNGKSDFYFNMIIGLSDKWLDMEKLVNFFDSFEKSRGADELSEYAWLGLENSLYEREITFRPVMADLRKNRAEEFFKVQQSLSRQQMELMSIPVYNQQQARWAFVSGRRKPLLSFREEKLYEALWLSYDEDTDALLARLRSSLEEFFRHSFSESERHRGSPRNIFRKLWGKNEKGKLKNNDHLIIRAGSGLGDPLNAVHLNQEAGFSPDPTKAKRDREYIELCFGKSRYPEAEIAGIESVVCVGHDAGTRLWFADALLENNLDASDIADINSDLSSIYAGKTDISEISEKRKSLKDVPERLIREIKDIHKSAAAQGTKNLEYYRTHSLQIMESIRKLSSQIDTVVSSYLKHLPEKANAGRLDSGRAYRLPVFGDGDIFLREGDEAENHLFVDILLDASQSRMNVQETIASEAFIVSESLRRAGVPVQVMAFRSLRGYTVIENLKTFEDRNSMGIFKFFSSGWNRDALAFKAVNFLINERLKKNSFEKHILLILTDASPNDSTPISPLGGEERSRNYEGSLPVEDALEAVKALRKAGIQAAALFHGSTWHLENVYQIFGKEYIRLHSLSQISSGFLDLLQMILSEMEAV